MKPTDQFILTYNYFLSRPEQNDQHFADIIFKCILWKDMFCIYYLISLRFISEGLVDNLRLQSWSTSGDKRLPDPMLTNICATIWHHKATMSQVLEQNIQN